MARAAIVLLTGVACQLAQVQSLGNCNDEISLMQHQNIVTKREGRGFLGGDDGEESCGVLQNNGAYFSVKVGVGTPVEGSKQQEFDLVADTGSDSVIVTSCVCVQQKFCDADSKCFIGGKKSSTFAVKEGHDPNDKNSTRTGPLGVAMTFGSGTVMSIIASDDVRVAGKKAKMKDGLLLMVDRRQLKIQGKFEGILGLGPPSAKEKKAEAQAVATVAHRPNAQQAALAKAGYEPRLFLQRAGVERYSLCFNDAGDPGAIRLNVPKFEKPLPTIGSFHWGLGLHGISVGNENTNAFVCTPDEMKGDQKTPCGGIPDSGTTLIMGPKDHIVKMFSALCDNWDRCKQAQTSGYLKKESKANAFQKLLYDCNDWKTKEKGIHEVPSVFFNMGEPGNQQKVELTSWSYVVETQQKVYKHHMKYLFGVVPVDMPEDTGETKKVCVPSFGVQVYNTKDNGPVWILGHPLFYQYTVGYSLGRESQAPGAKGDLEMAFMKQKCNSCDAAEGTASLDSEASLLSSDEELQNTPRPMRTMDEPPLVPQRELSLPL